eukprot:351058-Chlamydomonas_euryale.AAC.11
MHTAYCSETLQGLDQDWVWSKKTYTFFEELGGGDPELDENKERLRTIMELEPGSIIKISSADNQVGWHGTNSGVRPRKALSRHLCTLLSWVRHPNAAVGPLELP